MSLRASQNSESKDQSYYWVKEVNLNKVTCCMIPIIWNSRKGSWMESRFREKEEWINDKEDFEGTETILYTAKVDTRQNTFVKAHGLYNTKSEPEWKPRTLVIMMCQCRSINGNKHTFCWEMWKMGEMCMCGTGVHGNSLYFPLNFAGNIILLKK